MINLFNKKQEKKKALSLDEIKFIATNHPNQEAKDKAGKRMLEAYREKDSIYEIKNILGDDRYSLKTRILAGEECLEVLSRLNKCEIDKKEELYSLSYYNEYPKEIREKAGIKYVDFYVSEGFYSPLLEISENENYLLEIRKYAKNKFNLAIENSINYHIKHGNFDSLLSFEKDLKIPTNLQERAREGVREALNIRLKGSYDQEIPNYFFGISKQENIPESIKDWLKKEGTKIAIKNVETFYAHNNYSNLKNYTSWSWVPQEVQEFSKKKLEELVIEMGKRL
ncbi:MAG: hypothetical protein AABY06_02405 [Nanoarchaeota archaeon]